MEPNSTVYRDEYQGQDNTRWELDVSDWLITYKLSLEGWSINEKNKIEKSKRPLMNSSGSTALISILLHYISHHHILGVLQAKEIKRSAKQAAFAILEHLMFHYNEYDLHLGDIQAITLGVQNMVSQILNRGLSGKERDYRQGRIISKDYDYEPKMAERERNNPYPI